MRHVIWDWYGTLVADHHIVIGAVNAVLDYLGAGSITLDYYVNHYHRPVRGFYDRLLGRSLTDDDWNNIDAIFNEHYANRLASIPLAQHAENVLAAIHDAGKTQSLLSMWRHDLVLREVERYGIGAWFRRIDGNRTRSGDPKSQSLRLHLEELGLKPSDVTMIGDTLDDFDAASSIGAGIILVTGSQNTDRLRATGAPVVDSLSEVLPHLA